MARVNRIAIAAALACCAASAHADPVSLIGGILGAWGAGAAAGTAIGTALASVAGFIGVSVGTLGFMAGSLVFGTISARRKAKKALAAARDQYNANLQDRMVTALSTAAPWQVIYGESTVGGSLEAILTSGDKDQYKHLVIVLAAHECEAITDVQINGESLGALDGAGYVTSGKFFKGTTNTVSEYVDFDGTGTGTITTAGAALVTVSIPHGGEDGDEWFPDAELDVDGVTITGGPISLTAQVSLTTSQGSAMVRVQKHLGADDQAADATLLAECADEWSATDRLRGRCYLVVRLDLNEAEFQGGPPNITATVKGRKVYDHRSETTAWSSNPALCVADYLMAPWGKNAAFAEIQWDTVNAAANACDEEITVGDWEGVRYDCNGAFRTDSGDSDAGLEDLLASMAGWADGGGGWRIGAGVWTIPLATLGDDDNAGPVQIVGGEAMDELFNGVRGQFADASRGGVATDFEPYQNAAYVASDGRALWMDAAFPYTNDPTRCRNLARIMVERARGETLSYPAKLAVVNRMRVGDRVSITCSALAIAAQTFRLQQRDETPGREVMLTFKQDLATNYDTVDAESPPPGSYEGVPDPYAVPAPVGLAAATGDGLALIVAGTVVPRILVSVTGAPQHTTDQLQVQWRPTTEADWQQTQAPIGQQQLYIDNVDLATVYIIRARWNRPIVGAYSDWAVTSIQVAGRTEGPAPFDEFGVTVLDSGLRRFEFAYTTTVQPQDWQGAEIRYVAGTVGAPDWDTMTPVNAPGQPYPASPVDTNIPAAGTWTFACRSRGSGGLSTALVESITLGPPPNPVYIPDLTAPPAPTGVSVTSGLTAFYVETDVPAYTEGHGHQRGIVYGIEYTGGALPVFTDSRELAQYSGSTVGVNSPTNTVWRVWIRWESMDGVLSAVSGGVNGWLVVTTQAIAGDIADNAIIPSKIQAGAVGASKLAANAVELTKFAAGIEPVAIITVPPLPVALITRAILYVPNNKIYRWNGAAYVTPVDGNDLIANSVIAGKIAAAAVGTTELAARAATVEKLTVSDFTNLVENGEFELGDVGWTYPAASWTITNNAANAYQGDWYASNNAPGAGEYLRNHLQVAVNENDEFYAEARIVKSAGTAGGRVELRGLAADGSEVWIAQGNLVTSTAGYTKSLVMGRVPTAAEQAALAKDPVEAVHVQINTTNGTGTVRVDQVRMKRRANADLIVDGGVTAKKLTLADFTVLADNHDFESGDTSWTPSAAGWAISQLGVGTAYQGAWGATIVAPGAASYLRNELLVPVVPGQEFYAEAYFKGTGTAGGRIMIRGIDEAGAEQWTVTGNTVTGGTWAVSSVAGAVGAGVKYVHVQLACTAGTGTVSADYARLLRKNGANLIVDGGVAANHLAANSIAVGTAAVQNAAIVNAMLGTASVDTLKIGNNSVVVPVLAQSNTIISGTNTWQNVISGTINLPYAATIAIMFTAFQSFGAGPASYGLRMKIDGTTVLDTGVLGAHTQVMLPFNRGYAAAAGSHTVDMEWYGDVMQTMDQRTLILFAAMR